MRVTNDRVMLGGKQIGDFQCRIICQSYRHLKFNSIRTNYMCSFSEAVPLLPSVVQMSSGSSHIDIILYDTKMCRFRPRTHVCVCGIMSSGVMSYPSVHSSITWYQRRSLGPTVNLLVYNNKYIPYVNYVTMLQYIPMLSPLISINQVHVHPFQNVQYP